jgi:hypothetical protein
MILRFVQLMMDWGGIVCDSAVFEEITVGMIYGGLWTVRSA